MCNLNKDVSSTSSTICRRVETNICVISICLTILLKTRTSYMDGTIKVYKTLYVLGTVFNRITCMNIGFMFMAVSKLRSLTLITTATVSPLHVAQLHLYICIDSFSLKHFIPSSEQFKSTIELSGEK